MRVLSWSKLKNIEKRTGWEHAGELINYYRTDIVRSGFRRGGPRNVDDEEDEEDDLDFIVKRGGAGGI